MNPYLEAPELWSEVHSRLIVALADSISEQLSDAYRVAIKKRTYLSSTVTIPMAEEVQERYLEIRDVSSGAVVTAVELLSPKNKRAGEGRRAYDKKRYKVLANMTSLVEIDLLRGVTPLPVDDEQRQGCYSILVSRSDLRPRAELYEFGLQQSIPPFALPLKPEDRSLMVELQALLKGVYRRAKYHLAIDYSKPLRPVLSESELTWVRALLEKAH